MVDKRYEELIEDLKKTKKILSKKLLKSKIEYETKSPLKQLLKSKGKTPRIKVKQRENINLMRSEW